MKANQWWRALSLAQKNRMIASYSFDRLERSIEMIYKRHLLYGNLT